MLLSLITSFAILATSVEEPIHPAFSLSKEAFEAVWDKGIKEGKKKHDAKSAIDKFQRQIDSYQPSQSHKTACSWATLMHPRLMVYFRANQSALQYWPESDVEKAKQDMSQYGGSEQQFLGFYITLNEMPNFGGSGGRLIRDADPENLKDIHCVLKVGDRIIQPDRQPGDLTASKSEGVSYYSIPTTTYVRGKTDTSVSAHGGNGSYANGEGTSTSSYQVTSYSLGTNQYSTYHSDFIVLFPTRDKEGKPLITPTDKNIEIKVIKKSGELKTTFQLKDWISTFEK